MDDTQRAQFDFKLTQVPEWDAKAEPSAQTLQDDADAFLSAMAATGAR